VQLIGTLGDDAQAETLEDRQGFRDRQRFAVAQQPQVRARFLARRGQAQP